MNLRFFRRQSRNRGRRLVISDVHGCAKTLFALMEQIKPAKEDILYFLGDYIDRGPDSKAVLDFIFKLKEEGYKIFPLRGNHEDDMLILSKYNKPSLFETHFKTNGRNNLIDDNYKIEQKSLDFFVSLPYFFELKDFLIVHAGFYFKSKDPFKDKDNMLWIRDFEYDAKKAKNRIIIHGHTPTDLSEINEAIISNSKIIPLDNGCVYPEEGDPEIGNLLCFNLDTRELIIQENLDRKKCTDV